MSLPREQDVSGFLGMEFSSKNWLRGMMKWYNITSGIHPLFIYSYKDSLDGIFDSSNEYVSISPDEIDPILELLISLDNPTPEKIGKITGRHLIPDETVLRSKERYWPLSARSVISAVCEASVLEWENKVEHNIKTQSLTTLSLEMISELADLRGKISRRSDARFPHPSWWHLLSTSGERSLKSFIVGNADQTAGSIFAEIECAIECMRTSTTCSKPLFPKQNAAICLSLTGIPQKVTSMLLIAYLNNAMKKERTGNVFLVRPDEWREEDKEEILRIITTKGFSSRVFWNALTVPDENPFWKRSKGLYWGMSEDATSLRLFDEKAGHLPLPIKGGRPNVISQNDVICLENGIWSLFTMDELLSDHSFEETSPRKPDGKKKNYEALALIAYENEKEISYAFDETETNHPSTPQDPSFPLQEREFSDEKDGMKKDDFFNGDDLPF